jgi:hypothetical protein
LLYIEQVVCTPQVPSKAMHLLLTVLSSG